MPWASFRMLTLRLALVWGVYADFIVFLTIFMGSGIIFLKFIFSVERNIINAIIR